MKKRIRYFITVLVLIIFLPSCVLIFRDPIFRYSGEHIDLEAAMIHSVPGVDSRAKNEIAVIETDQYGRKLFASYVPSSILAWGDKSAAVFSLLIVQKTENDKVYFYGEQNYLFEFLPKETVFSTDLVMEYFSEEDIVALKQRNMWNEPFPEFDPNLCSVAVEVEKSEKMTKASLKNIENTLGEKNLRTEFLRKDANGKSMYFVKDPNPDKYVWYIAMLNEDGTLVNEEKGLLMLDQSGNISEQILKFRTENGWVNQ